MANFAFRSVVAAVLVFAGAASAADFYVSPRGSDAGAGSAVQPFATLGRAQTAARALAGKEPITVHLAAGVYDLAVPLVFTAADSGTAAAPVVYRGEGDGDAMISGAESLKLAWKPYRNGIMQADTSPGLAIDQLFVNGKLQHMARYPNFDPNQRIFNGYAADAFSKERAARWSNPVGGFMHAMHRSLWGDFAYRITGKDASGNLTYVGGWQNNRPAPMHPTYRYVENIFEELDAPGEWYHDAAKHILYYLPPAGTDLTKATVESVRLENLITFRGEPGKPVRFVELRGVTLSRAARTFMKTREPLLRSDWCIYRGGAVFAEHSEDCGLVDCRLEQLGGNAVFVSGANHRFTVRGCLIRDIGASGVAFVGEPSSVRSTLRGYSGPANTYAKVDKTPGPKTDDYPADCLVDDCLIQRIGRVEKQTAGVEISMSARITVRHSTICDVPRAGINIGDGCFGGDVIEFCDVFDTVRETGDHGSFNSWGRDRYWHLPGSPPDQRPELAKLDMIAPNVIRNSRWRCDHGWDIDLDDGSSNYIIENNLLLHGGLKLREGFNRVVENNVIVNNSLSAHVWYPNSHDVVRRNIVFRNYRPIRMPTPWGKEVDDNLLHTPGVTTPRPATELQAQSGRDEHSLVADAMFIDPAAGDYRVKEGSPALTLGFKNFPMDQFGVQKPSLKTIAPTPVLPGIQKAARHNAAAAAAVRTWHGAKVEPLTGEAYSVYGVSKEDGGVVLVNVPTTSPLFAAGLRSNDLIQKVNGQPVETVERLDAIVKTAAGATVTVSYVRNQIPAQLRMTLGHAAAAGR